MTDSQHLLAEYVQSASDAAFRDLVTRHLDLVYFAALRLVGGDPHQAEDVAQTVFADLARLARTLPRDVMLGGWLHRHTCFVAAHTLRGERRRQSRERQAVEMNTLRTQPQADLSAIGPILDDAVNELGEADRTAILLRFFEEQEFRAVGEALGSNEDAARMRVNRALEKLHVLLSRRGITSSTAALTVLLSTNAVQAAPVGLATTIAAAVTIGGTATLATATAASSKAIAMTTLQKTLIAATLATVVGTGVYEIQQTSTLRNQVQALQQQQAPLAAQVEELTRERDEALSQLTALREESDVRERNAGELLKLRAEVTRLRALEEQTARSGPPAQSSTDPFTRSVLTLSARAAELNQQLERMPDKRIPELQFLTESDWLAVAKDATLQTDAEVRQALSKLRSLAKNKFGMLATHALDGFIRANNGDLPSDPAQLKPFFEVPVDDETLQRYRMLHTGNLKDLPKDTTWVISERAPVDRDYDSHLYIGPNGRSGSWGTGRGSTGDPDETWATRE